MCSSQVHINTAVNVIAGARTEVPEYYCLTLSKTTRYGMFEQS